jgi:dTDP-glucose pyrophosphorylase
MSIITIILCGGPINFISLPVGTNSSNAMIPVNGKPVIGWILDDLLRKNIQQVTIVLRADDHRLRAFLERAYASRMDLQVVQLSNSLNILQSLQAGLTSSQLVGKVRVVLGDTLIADSFEGEQDFVYVSPAEGARRWCLAKINEAGQLVDYRDKQPAGENHPPALAGYYHFCHGVDLHACVESSLKVDETELSNVLRRYGQLHPLYARFVKEWYDFGHIDNLVDARRRLLQPRSFNQLSVDPVLNTLTKISRNSQKLQDELDWYAALPEELQALTPRILSRHAINGNGKVQIVQEYYGYPTLAELYIYGDLHPDIWRSILRHLLRIHQVFRRYSGKLASNDILEMYLGKTLSRLDEVRQQNPEWAGWLDQEHIHINGQMLNNLPRLEKAICQRANDVALSASVSLIHGDFCFSNILFDVAHQIARLIDPRGRFGRKGPYGDPRYDLAKLRHSAHEGYDFIVTDMFEMNSTPNGGEFRLFSDGTLAEVGLIFDELLMDAGYDLLDIKFIEGLLFLSMLPLHDGQPRRQQVMYLTSIQLLNEVLSCELQ